MSDSSRRFAGERVVILEPIDAAARTLMEDAGLEVVDLSARHEAADATRPKDGPAAAGPPRAELLEKATAVIVRSGTRVDRAFLDRTPRLKVVARAGSGLDNVDLEETDRRGIAVVNAAGSNALAAAEHTFALLLALLRHIVPAHRHLEEGGWERSRFVGTELAGKTLGLIGVGRIGRLVAARALAFDMRVLASDPLLEEATARELGVTRCELDALLENADVVSLHLPLTPQTRRFLAEEELGRLRPTAVLVNAARGGLVDEAALARALEEGRLAGAALDAFEEEPPPPDHPLLHRDDVVHTPHLGASTVEAAQRVGAQTVRALLRALEDWAERS